MDILPEDDEKSNFVRQYFPNSVMEDDILMYRDKRTQKLKIFVPKTLRIDIMEANHDNWISGHMGQKRTSSRILSKYFWPNIRKDIELYVRSCENCQFRKGPQQLPKAPLKSLEIVGPHERLVIDTLGPLKVSKMEINISWWLLIGLQNG